jgi:hypothetical protein
MGKKILGKDEKKSIRDLPPSAKHQLGPGTVSQLDLEFSPQKRQEIQNNGGKLPIEW